MGIPNAKIEERAISTIQDIVNDHPTMQASFNKQDKIMSWDGDITIYSSNKTQSKKYFDDKIPVQIKGHVDNDCKYIKRQRITYKVDLEDLDVYFKDRGIVYFLIFITEDGENKAIFYNSLFCSKIKEYRERARQKGNKGSINIPFNKLRNNGETLYSILKQFSIESRKQGSGQGQVVPKTVPLKELSNINEIEASLVSKSNGINFMDRFSDGDVCLYTKVDGILAPIEWSDRFELIFKTKDEIAVCVNDNTYYKGFTIKVTSGGSYVVVLSENLEIDMKEEKFIFRPRTTINQMLIDAKFLMELANNTKFTVAGEEFSYGLFSLSIELRRELEFIVNAYNTLEMIEFDFDLPATKFSENTFHQLQLLIDLKNGKYNELCGCDNFIYDWKIESKFVPVIVMRHKKDEKNELFNAAYSSKIAVSIGDKEGNQYRVPLIAAIKNNIFKGMYYYDCNSIERQIETEDVNEYTLDSMTTVVLHLINAYDLSGNKKLLDLAEKQMKKCEQIAFNEEYFIINKMQIKIREGSFDENDKTCLKNIQCDNKAILFCVSVLLNNREDAAKYLTLLTDKEKENIEGWPIMNLYQQL